jgi:hypothetical protein
VRDTPKCLLVSELGRVSYVWKGVWPGALTASCRRRSLALHGEAQMSHKTVVNLLLLIAAALLAMALFVAGAMWRGRITRGAGVALREQRQSIRTGARTNARQIAGANRSTR